MKQVNLMFLLFIVLTSIGLNSCRKDAEKFVGIYNARDTWVDKGQLWSFDYTLTVSQSASNTSMVLLKGLNDMQDIIVEASINGNNLTIPQQTFSEPGLEMVISGSGSLSGIDLTVNYSIRVNSTVFNISCNASKI